MNSICEDVRAKRVLVADGAWGTSLVAQGLGAGEAPELWCIERPDKVRAVARSFVEAGAEIVMTNSFGGTRFKLEQSGLGDRVSEINEAAARLSREAAGDSIHVMASVGPTGKMLLMGDITPEQMYEVFREQMAALERGGADACIIETMTDVEEAALAIRAAKENTTLEVAVSLTYTTKTSNGYRTMMGVSPVQAAARTAEAGADIVGTNCSLGAEDMVDVVAELNDAATGRPILAFPNAGRPIQRDDGTVDYPETPETLAAHAPRLIEAGARIVGGCCGTTAEHIAALRAAVDRILSP
ncbi:MAG TPA: methionine synthase [Candidatus Hydrogenedentes bacterium]|nr:methionine synthase [Candidatus Hydrogenedentota bacterium]